MSISRRIARPLLASMFISGGIDAIRNPDSKVKAAEAVTQPLKERFPVLPQDTATLVRLNGMVQVGAGSLLAIGKFRRLAAWALIGSILPTTYAGHRFWEEGDDETRAQQRVHFLKNLGLLGGLIFAAFDTDGAPSLGWRTRRQARRVTSAVSAGRGKTESSAHRASATAAERGRAAKRQAEKAAQQANKRARRAGHRANRAVADAAKSSASLATPYVRHLNDSTHEALQAAKSSASLAPPYVRHLNETTHDAFKAALDSAEPLIAAGVERAGELVAKAAEHLPG